MIAAKEELSSARSVAPIDYTAQIAAPLLGLFGNDDTHPSPAQMDHGYRCGAEAVRQGL